MTMTTKKSPNHIPPPTQKLGAPHPILSMATVPQWGFSTKVLTTEMDIQTLDDELGTDLDPCLGN